MYSDDAHATRYSACYVIGLVRAALSGMTATLLTSAPGVPKKKPELWVFGTKLIDRKVG